MLSDAAPSPPVEVLFTPEFKRNLRQLAKKYRRIKADVQPLLDELTQGHTAGDQIPGVRYTVFKARVKNSDSRKGKSGGYRIIYQRVHERLIVLVTIYSKTEQADIAPQEIRQIILDYEAQPADEATPAEPTTLRSDTTVNDTGASR
jgi:mRNA-degrading endonuclease RelE of RelBE toxin-antitoxin system